MRFFFRTTKWSNHWQPVRPQELAYPNLCRGMRNESSSQWVHLSVSMMINKTLLEEGNFREIEGDECAAAVWAPCSVYAYKV